MASPQIVSGTFVYMNMRTVSLLLLPVAAAFALLYGPAVYASLNPGNEIMAASNYTFQSDTFSAAGAASSLTGDPSGRVIITGRWSLDVQGSAVAGFSADLAMVNASGGGYHTIQLSNLSSTEVMVDANGTALIMGVLDIVIDGTEKLSGVSTTISLANLRALNTTLGEPDYQRADIRRGRSGKRNRDSFERPPDRRQQHPWQHYRETQAAAATKPVQIMLVLLFHVLQRDRHLGLDQ